MWIACHQGSTIKQMTKDSKDIWIQSGYELFADKGPSGLKIEVLAKKVGISKSSFYHHFADIEIFTQLILSHHLYNASIISEKEKRCENIDPELISVLLEHKIDLLFNRQLRVSRQNKIYEQCLCESNKIMGTSFINVWTKVLKPTLSPNVINGVYELALENFYLQITPDTLNRQWLSAYFKNLTRLVTNLGSQ